MKESTLVLILQEISQELFVLLARKARKLGMGRWNGYGGKVELGQSVRENAVSEVAVECSILIDPVDLEHVATLRGHFKEEVMGSTGWEVHIFLARKWQGKERESKEMLTPTWFAIHSLPAEMIKSDKEWMERVLRGEKLLIEVFFGNDENTVERTVIQPLIEFV